MSSEASVPPLAVDTKQKFEKQWYVFEVVCWIVMTAIVAAAVAGLLGKGPLDQATSGFSGAPGSIGYERFGHYMVPSRYEVRFGAAGGPLTVHIDRRLLAGMDIVGVSPRPAAVAEDGKGLSYQFATSRAGGEIQFRLQSRAIGIFDGAVTLNGAPARIHQYILP